MVKDLLEFKKKSENLIDNRKTELNTIKSKLSGKVVLADTVEGSVNKLEEQFKLLKIRFALLKLCQRKESRKINKMEKPDEKSIVEKLCNFTFKTKNGNMVHMDMEHQTKHERRVIKMQTLYCHQL